MIQITVNGKAQECDSSVLSEVLLQLHEKDKPFAVALNKTFVPRGRYAETALQNGDVVEIVTPMQGG